MTKQQIIHNEWSDLGIILLISQYDFDGWIDVNELEKNQITDKLEYKKYFELENGFETMLCRPKSLKGIENNNGWTKIESQEDLPKIGSYDMSSFKLIYWTNGGQYEANDYKKWILHYPHLEITHYQFIPIIKPNEPLY